MRSTPGSPLTLASSTPPVIISLIRSGLPWAILRTRARHSSSLCATAATEPAICPPGTVTARSDTSMRGPTVLPALIRSRMAESTPSRPPTVRMVVTPESSSVFAAFSQTLRASARVIGLLIKKEASLAASVSFFFGAPVEGRCRCRLMRPGIRYLPPRSTTSQPS